MLPSPCLNVWHAGTVAEKVAPIRRCAIDCNFQSFEKGDVRRLKFGSKSMVLLRLCILALYDALCLPFGSTLDAAFPPDSHYRSQPGHSQTLQE